MLTNAERVRVTDITIFYNPSVGSQILKIKLNNIVPNGYKLYPLFS